MKSLVFDVQVLDVSGLTVAQMKDLITKRSRLVKHLKGKGFLGVSIGVQDSDTGLYTFYIHVKETLAEGTVLPAVWEGHRVRLIDESLGAVW